jgi:hypothetical protein
VFSLPTLLLNPCGAVAGLKGKVWNVRDRPDGVTLLSGVSFLPNTTTILRVSNAIF